MAAALSFDQEVDLLIRSRSTLIVVETIEEERLVAVLRKMCERTGRVLVTWDTLAGFETICGMAPKLPEVRVPSVALQALADASSLNHIVCLLRDFHAHWESPHVSRTLRTLAQSVKPFNTTLVVSTPVGKVPPELAEVATEIELPLPSLQELHELMIELLKRRGAAHTVGEAGYRRILQAALGLSYSQAERVFSRAMVADGALNASDIDVILEEKKHVVRRSGVLDFYAAREQPGDVAGLGVLKNWLERRKLAFSPEARKYGLEPPKGIALIGLPGTGKSLTAKAIAGWWGLPLLRLDVGALYAGLLGQSEENVRKALALAETVAPCVLWIDELEKGLSTGDNDGGTSRRVLGNILSWMQDKKQTVFLVATANNVESVPPELLRRGRFDEIFFLDLPTEVERRAIFEVHLRRRKRDPAAFDLAALVAASDAYVGAEIEQSIIDGMFLAFSDKGRELATADIVTALGDLVPLSRAQRERIDELRSWVREGRARPASDGVTLRGAS